jgi:hypothetical protein
MHGEIKVVNFEKRNVISKYGLSDLTIRKMSSPIILEAGGNEPHDP